MTEETVPEALLLVWEGNWADEIDLFGLEIVHNVEAYSRWQKAERWLESVSAGKLDGIEMHVGSNQVMQIYDIFQAMREYSEHPISKATAEELSPILGRIYANRFGPSRAADALADMYSETEELEELFNKYEQMGEGKIPIPQGEEGVATI